MFVYLRSSTADYSEPRFEAFEYDTRFFVNPGSATGAFSPLWTPPPAPSIKSAESTSPAAANQDSDQAKPESISVDPLISKPTSAVTSSYPPTPTPSFALLDIQGTVVVRLYPRRGSCHFSLANIILRRIGGLCLCTSGWRSTSGKSRAPGEREFTAVKGKLVRGKGTRCFRPEFSICNKSRCTDIPNFINHAAREFTCTDPAVYVFLAAAVLQIASLNFDSARKENNFTLLRLSRDPSKTERPALRMSSLPLKENPVDLPWIVMKYGGTSVGKFLDTIATEIVP